MTDVDRLLQIVKDITDDAGRTLRALQNVSEVDHKFSDDLPREMKASVDKVLEKRILGNLAQFGLPILSEECGEIRGAEESHFKFIVDPLDGTVNFVRGLGSATVSIALFKKNQPVFGVMSIYPTGDLVWGGKKYGAFFNNQSIRVSTISDRGKAVICSGFPSRFQFEDNEILLQYIHELSCYAKVRMLGSASISLLQVAKGSAELYHEKNIMLWDVAAGLAIVEGAGGAVSVSPGSIKNAIDVVASNGRITVH